MRYVCRGTNDGTWPWCGRAKSRVANCNALDVDELDWDEAWCRDCVKVGKRLYGSTFKAWPVIRRSGPLMCSGRGEDRCLSGVDGTMTNRDVQDMLQFFTYSHLPPNLQGMSKLFADLAHALGSMTPEEGEAERGLILASQARSLFTTLIGEVDGTTPPNYQATRAVNKVGKAKDAFAHNSELMEVLNFLIEGKDCAVRALLFKHQG